MKNKRVSITDIARELKVTASTVSRALNGTGKVSEKRKREILDLAKKLGYRPNPFARNLVENKTHTIGVLIPEFTHHFYSRVLAGIESVTSKSSYHLIICTSNEKQKQEIKACHTFLDARVDGVLATISKKNEKFRHLQEIIDSGTQLVLIDRQCEELESSYVVSNDFEGAFKAVSHLIHTGCKSIVHIQGPKNLSTTFNRNMGYQEALKKQSLTYQADWIVQSDDQEILFSTIRHLLTTQGIDGVFAYSDYLAYEVYKIAVDLGLKIPQDLSIIGFADEPMAGYLSPKLTTVDQKPFEMGAQAARILLSQIDNPDFPQEFLSLQTELIVRDSTL